MFRLASLSIKQADRQQWFLVITRNEILVVRDTDGTAGTHLQLPASYIESAGTLSVGIAFARFPYR